ncbi:potassium channel family protein [Aciduricibacillus chroicocephali]|uniref:Potassium channel family protein n=1 Tax=Aciduricibacillus chroicocephali TaxID=3054939 RepID=A0ABY9KT11_9BACI|nr:potassium channel family protein [Bacillaceae bacterium 44XB]
MKKLFLKHAFLRVPLFLRLIIAIPLAMTLFGVLIHFIEPETFPTVFTGIWWTFVTASTVGYGDYVPETFIGKLAGIVLILSGGGLITFYITSVSAAAVRHGNQLTEGKIAFKGQQHYIFIGWNEQTREIFQKIKKKEPDKAVVVIDRTMHRFPLERYPIHFIRGDASLDRTLELASIHTASSVIITADPGMPPRQADNHTILVSIAVRGNNDRISIIAELLTDQQLENAKRAGVTALVRTDRVISSLLFHELYSCRQSTPFRNTMHLLDSQQFHHEAIERKYIGKSYAQLLPIWKDKDLLLLGYIRESSYHMNPPAQIKFKESDILISLIPLKN